MALESIDQSMENRLNFKKTDVMPHDIDWLSSNWICPSSWYHRILNSLIRKKVDNICVYATELDLIGELLPSDFYFYIRILIIVWRIKLDCY